jgi:hypothetical protein
MDKRDYLEQNIERLLGSVEPEMKLPEAKKREILTELARQDSTSYRSALWRTLIVVPNWAKFAAAAVLIIVLLAAADLLWNNSTREKTPVAIEPKKIIEGVSENKIQAITPEQASMPKFVEQASTPDKEFVLDEAYESLKVSKELDVSILQSEPNYSMLLAARAAKPKDIEKSKPEDIKIAMSHGTGKDGLAAFLICEQNQFKLDEPVPVMYGVVYGGPDEKVTILAPGAAVDPGNISWLSVTGPDGNGVPYTGVYVMFPLPDPKDALQLRRRRFHGYLASNIRYSFKLCTSGTYTIKWHCEMRPVDGVSCWTGELVSNEIQIEIVK